MAHTKISKEKAQQNKLARLRHSAAHILAAAVVKLYPGSKIGTGPATEDGFFYDIETAKPITQKDLKYIEKEAQIIIAAKTKFVQKDMAIDQAHAYFVEHNQPYKAELIDKLKAQGKKSVSLYESGDFVDLCEGPHVKNASEIGAFKLLSLAGAYWLGDEAKPQMTRIFGTAFNTKKELDDFLKLLEEAKKRDHKKLGQDLDLFSFSPLVGAGLPLWTPRGMLVRLALDEYVWELRNKRAYQRVDIPHIAKKDLYVKSGHWDKFKDELFKIITREGHFFAMKPMNCPAHTQIYARRRRSYKELPVRYANTTMVYRDEQSGELSGLTRVRAITQDDAHVFCRASQVKEEIKSIWDIVSNFYAACGFKLKAELSLSDPNHPEKYLGSKEVWEKSENILREVVKENNAHAEEMLGEAAFYGPKIDFIARDSLNRRHQVATIQLDMNLPERFDLSCVNEKGENERIVMIHAAIMGSIERFLAIVIEHYAGAFPVWMAPVQITVLPISANQTKEANIIAKKMHAACLRVEIDAQDETIGKRIRKAELAKVPYLVIIGDKEIKTKKIAIRQRGKGDLGQKDLDQFINQVSEQNKKRLP